MKLSVIIPCHPRNLPTLPRTRESVERAAEGLDAEILVVGDPEGRGLPWARNRGLERASGDVVFFVDADDTVRPGFIRRPVAELVASRADFCIFENSLSPLRRDYRLDGNRSVRAALLPAFIGFSFDDVRRWNAGGDLFANREPGSVCRVAFRREFLERNRIRFDERLRIYEDAPFMAECALCAGRVASLRECLYDYRPGPDGITARETRSRRYWDYKFAVHDRRLELDRRYGDVWRHCEASPAFTALELLRCRRSRDLRGYLSLPRVRESLRSFPLSLRHPLAAMAVSIAKCW